MEKAKQKDRSIVTAESPFSIGDVLSDSWHAVGGSKGAYWGAYAMAMLSALGFALIIGLVSEPGGDPGVIALAVLVLMILVLWVFNIGLLLLAIRRMRGEAIRAMMVFDGFDTMLPLLVAMLLMWIFLTVGFVLFFLPGIYLSIAYIFTFPLILDKRLGPWEAMETSRRTVSANWFRYFFVCLALLIIVYLINFIGGLVLIGVIWTVPFTLNVFGSLYVRSFPAEE